MEISLLQAYTEKRLLETATREAGKRLEETVVRTANM